ncbi:SDR family NAD(P)-dependent oxidoreductase [Amycolatopsis jejuensis]|uniref:SDR family NAD(P)-dependent oxidoreductase n=1 Tax=Amycolatopsis jejuensis TaxID=330084 RepID=UPI000527D242|nr:SDR family oxidoreductase [Amycolatopsis jejuensis]
MSREHLEGRSVLVTGGGSGIGRGIALAFADAGARVTIAGRREDALADTVALRPGITACAGDITSPADVTRIVEAASGPEGELDVLVNNAGRMDLMELAECDPDRVRALFSTNIVGTTQVTQAALPALRARKGLVVNVTNALAASRKGATTGAGFLTAGKAALDSLTRTWAYELAPDIRVNAVAPGMVRSWEGDGHVSSEVMEYLEEASQKALRRRIGAPADIAYWVLALADPAAEWTTGQTIVLDGGLNVA